MNGHHELIVNHILRVPYLSNIKLHCIGPGVLLWEHKYTKLDDLPVIPTNAVVFNVDKNNTAVTTISKFDLKKVGFYTCRSFGKFKLVKTVLVTSCKLIVL